MKTKRTGNYGVALVAIVALALPCGLAGAMVVDGDPTDWLGNNTFFTNASDQLDAINDAPHNPEWEYTMNQDLYQDSNGAEVGSLTMTGDNDTPWPGGGGQDFDVEAVYATYQDNPDDWEEQNDSYGLYTGIFTGFDAEGEGGGNGDYGSTHAYTAGDVFFNFGGPFDDPDEWDLAIDLDTGIAYGGTGNTWWDNPSFSVARPFEVNSTAVDLSALYAAAGGGGVGVDSDYGDAGAGDGGDLASDHNFIETFVSQEFLQWGAGEYGWDVGIGNETSRVQIHWTMSCGNDIGEGYGVTRAGVPEPMSMVMLGCLGAGMLGARRVRRKKG